MFERRLYYHIDWVLIGAVLALCALGLAMIYSTTGGAGRVYWTQVYALGLGLIAMGIAVSIDYRSLADKSHWIYLAMMILLVGVLFFGSVRGGSRRWIDLGSFNLQPSEFAKAVLALMLAKMLGEEAASRAHQQRSLHRRRADGVPFLIIARQPDLGHRGHAACRSCSVVAYVAGMPMKYIYAMLVVAVLAAPIAYKFGLQDYQKRTHLHLPRSGAGPPAAPGTSRFRPASPSAPAGCGVKASGRGTQGQLRFLPSRTTTSSSRCSPRSRDWSACSSRSGCTSSSSCARSMRPVWPRTVSAPISCWACSAAFTFQVIYNITMSAGLAPVKGTDAAVDELRRLFHDRDAGRIRAHSQRQNAPL
jgi:rod shape determining protein RodA